MDGKSVGGARLKNQEEKQPDGIAVRAGLCASCSHVQMVKTSKGSTFVLCRLSESDPGFRKYPVLPVVQCGGYQSRQPDRG
jgi:hypothetical protein